MAWRAVAAIAAAADEGLPYHFSCEAPLALQEAIRAAVGSAHMSVYFETGQMIFDFVKSGLL